MRILITGGTGSFGQYMTEHLLKNTSDRIIIFSRDEQKQEDIRRKFQDDRIEYIIGDVRDYQSILDATKSVQTVLHASALKIITTCENNPMEALKTNTIGTYNVKKACIENKVMDAILISTDGTVYTAEQYAKCDKRIKVYKFKHIGAGDLHNKYNFALGKASGDYIAVLEGEDTTESDRFERELWHFNYKDTVLVYGKAQRFGNDFNTVPTIRPDSLSEQTMLKEMFLGCHIPMLTVMMRKDILIKAGGFKSYGTLIGADYATWLSLLPYGEFIFLNAVLSKWRMHDGNLSKSQSNKIKEVFDCGYFWYKRMPKEFKKKVGMNDWQMYILNRYRMLKSFLVYHKNKGGR